MRLYLRACILVFLSFGFLTATPLLSKSNTLHKFDGDGKTEFLDTCGQAEVGGAAPWLSGWTLDDKIFNIRKPLENTENRRLVLVFWATWCAPCREGLGVLQAAAIDLANAGVFVVLVNYGEPKEKIDAFFNNQSSVFPVVLDPYQNSSESYLTRPGGKQSLPLTVLIRPDGTVEKILGKEGDDYLEIILMEN